MSMKLIKLRVNLKILQSHVTCLVKVYNKHCLKILEGTTASVPPQGGRKHPNQELIQIDTTNILFILGGAFDGIDEVIKRRLGEKVIGFASNEADKYDEEALLEQIRPEDLQSYGLIPEFIGRVPIVANLETLDVAALKNILTQPKNALVKQYTKMLELDNVELEFSEEALSAISEKQSNVNRSAWITFNYRRSIN